MELFYYYAYYNVKYSARPVRYGDEENTFPAFQDP